MDRGFQGQSSGRWEGREDLDRESLHLELGAEGQVGRGGEDLGEGEGTAEERGGVKHINGNDKTTNKQ